MTIPQTEFAKARRWRESLDLGRGGIGIEQEELGQFLGYSRMSIYWFEEGKTPPVRGKNGNRKIKPWVWHRYKLACAGFAAQLASRKKFDW